MDGYLDEGPSITGSSQLQRFFDQQDVSRFPAMGQFLTHGLTNQPAALGTEARALARKATDSNVKITLKCLAQSAAKAKEIVFLTT